MKRQYKLPFSLFLVILVLVSLVIAASAGLETEQTVAFPNPRDSATAAVTWLFEENQNKDGGFGIDFGTRQPASSIESTLDAVLAISAAGYNAGVPHSTAEKSAIDYLLDHAADLKVFAAIAGGTNGKVIMALASANQNARDFSDHDYVTALHAQYEPSGSYDNTTAFYQAMSIIALAAVGEPVPEKALEWLEDLQAPDGSWDDGFGTPKNADATAMSVMALLMSGREPSDARILAALDFLGDSQLGSGGWEYGTGFGENANSTALAVQALAAAGENFYDDDGVWAKKGISPLKALLSWQNSTGAYQADFGQGRFDNFFASAQSIPASLGKPYPFKIFIQLMPIVQGE